jgi:hypothetical protein
MNVALKNRAAESRQDHDPDFLERTALIPFGALFSVNMLVNTAAGGSIPHEIKARLADWVQGIKTRCSVIR